MRDLEQRRRALAELGAAPQVLLEASGKYRIAEI